MQNQIDNKKTPILPKPVAKPVETIQTFELLDSLPAPNTLNGSIKVFYNNDGSIIEAYDSSLDIPGNFIIVTVSQWETAGSNPTVDVINKVLIPSASTVVTQWLVPKMTIVNRLETLGLQYLTAVANALSSNPAVNLAWQAAVEGIYNNDPNAINIFTLAGLSVTQISQILAEP